MRRLVISGYYGYGNAGDEALLAGMLAALRSIAPALTPVVLSSDPEGTRRLHGVAAVDRWSPWLVARTFRKAVGLVSGGGSLLQDVTSRRSIAYYLGIMEMARWLRVPYCIYGQGLGPLTSSPARWFSRPVLQRSKGIWVRDEASLGLLRELGVGGPTPRRVIGDPALMLPPPDTATARQELLSRLAGWGVGTDVSSVWVVAPRPWDDNERWLPRLAGALGRAAARARAVVGIVPMYAGVDDQVAHSLAIGLRRMSVPVGVLPASSFRVASTLLAGADLVVGMRLHALVLAANAGVPGVAISYDPKVTALAKDFALPYVSVAALAVAEGVSTLEQMIAEVWDDREERGARLAVAATRRRAQATAGLAEALQALGAL